jgi:hypothetical protein
VSLLGGLEDTISDWFSKEMTKKVGNGLIISLWFDHWVEGDPLKTHFILS